MQSSALGTQEGSHRRRTARESLLEHVEESSHDERVVRAVLSIRQTDLEEYTMRYTCAHCGVTDDDLESARNHDCSSEDGPTVVREAPA